MARFGALEVSDEFESLVWETLDHAIQSVSSGEVLIPMAFVVGEDGSKTLVRMPLEDIAAVHKALARLVSDPAKRVKAYALATDQLLSDDGGQKLDIIHLEAAERGAAHGVTFIQKYQKAAAGKTFAPLGNPGLLPDRPVDRFAATAPSADGGGFGPNGKFSEDEWAILRESPVFVFMMVAASDGSVDKKEVVAFLKVLGSATSLDSKLMQQVLVEVIDEGPGMISRIAQHADNFMARLGKVADIVERKLSADEARQFKLALMQISKRIAEASGGFFGFGNKISKEEEKALAAIFVALRLNA